MPKPSETTTWQVRKWTNERTKTDLKMPLANGFSA